MGISLQGQTNKLSAARASFAEGGSLPESLLPVPVARSWERSRQAGLLPWHSPNYEGADSRVNPRERPDDRRLAHCVADELERLWAAFGGRDWTMFCVNTRGVIVQSRQHLDADPSLLRPLQAGRRILEVDIGTTAPICTLTDDVPMLVRGNQHYLSAFESVFCLSVPLHGLEGELIGALDMTGIGERDPDLLLGYFRHAALASENKLFSTLRDCHVLRLQHDARWLQSPMRGLLALHADGHLRAANRWARRLLGLPVSGSLPVMSLEELLPMTTAQQRRRLLQPGSPKRVPASSGAMLHVEWLHGPKSAAGVKSKQAPMPSNDPPDLHRRELLAVREALRAHGGNVSAAARQLGISRSTFYKKMREGNWPDAVT